MFLYFYVADYEVLMIASGGSSHVVIYKGRLQKYSKNRLLPLSARLRNDLYCVEWDIKLYYTIPYPLSAFVHIWPNPLPVRTSTNVTKYAVNSDSWTSINYQMSVSDCCWHWQDTVLAAGCQWVLSIYLSVYCLYLERLSLHVASCDLFSL